MKRATVYFLAILILISLVISAINIDNSTQAALIPESTVTNIPHDQIHVNGNADFATQAANEGWVGDGSAGSPYVIEGYDIQTNSSDGIHIESTDVHFIIRNVNITYGLQEYEYNGTYLSNVKNGLIENCNIERMAYGIFISNSNDVNISTSHFFNCDENDIKLLNSASNTIFQNNLGGFYSVISVLLNNSNSNRIISNEFSTNIKLEDSPYNEISSNIFNNGCINVKNSDNVIIESNEISNLMVSALTLEYSSNSSISNNTVFDTYGVSIIYSNSNQFYGNNITDNGIYSYGSSNNTFRKNCISDSSTYGIHFFAYSSDNKVIANDIINNKQEGIKMSGTSLYNIVHHNNFIGNTDQISIIQQSTCTCDDMHGQGNYWDDYTGVDLDGDGVGDTELPHDGEDYYPLVKALNVQTWTEPDLYGPTIVRNLQKTSGNTYVNLTWEAPIDSGDAPITDYIIYRSTFSNAKEALITIGNILSYNDTTVLNGYEYFYKVSALNSIDEGPVSNEVYVRLAPSAPQNVTATGGDEYILITWDPPLYNAGLPVIYYHITRSNLTSIVSTFVVNNTLSLNDTGLTDGMTYYYQVSAHGGGLGYGPYSIVVNATTLGDNLVIDENDTDNDGLPDDWEILNFGNLTYGPEDDPDNDGTTNYQEMQAGTSPTDSTDVPSSIQPPIEDAPGITQYWWIILILILVPVVLVVAYLMKKKQPPEVSQEPENADAPEEQQEETGLR